MFSFDILNKIGKEGKVMKHSKIVLSLLPVLAFIMWNCEGPAGEEGAAGQDAPYVTVSPAMVSIQVGSTAELTAETHNGNDASYAWSSSNLAIADVSDGTVSGVFEGTAIVSVTGSDTKLTAVAVITVTTALAADYSFENHILPMLTTDNWWFPGTDKCSSCHFSNDEEEGSKHALDLTSWQGVMIGADPEDQTVVAEMGSFYGHSLFGQEDGDTSGFDWGHAMLKARLRNNRMPVSPPWEFRRDESNRLGPDIEFANGHAQVVLPHQYTSWDNAWSSDNPNGVLNGLGLVEAWVDEALSNVPERSDSTRTFSYGNASGLTFEEDIKQFFTDPDIWFVNSQPCTECHYGTEEPSYHEMDLRSFAGMIAGADGGEASLFNAGGTDEAKDWKNSRIRNRLRNNRMPPNAPFLLSEDNRDGPEVIDPVTGLPTTAVDLIGKWLEAGAQR